MRICIDPGHNYSDYDTGAVGNGLREQDITFEIADRLKKLLTNAGIEVTMTRGKITDNVGVNAKDSINQRVRIANNTRCDLFVSIHCNSHKNKNSNGTETLVFGFGGQAEKLAQKINGSIVSALETYDRGIKARTDLGVLEDTSMPAVLIETAFISNAGDAHLLRNNQKEFAEAICRGILEHLNWETEEKSMDIGKAKEILKTKAGLSEETITFLLCYKYGDALVTKLAEAMK